MDDEQFDKAIRQYTQAQIVAALGCGPTTAYSWLNGSRRPPCWQRDTWLDKIADETRREKSG